MSGSFAADMTTWCQKAKDNLREVVLGSCEDMFELMTRRQASIKETRTFREGFVPVDTGFLIGTSRLAINGAVRSRGTVGATGSSSFPADFAVGLAGAESGDYIEAFFTAEYARRLEYGFTGTDSLGRTYNQPGRYFVRNAVLQWPYIVQANADYIGSQT